MQNYGTSGFAQQQGTVCSSGLRAALQIALGRAGFLGRERYRHRGISFLRRANRRPQRQLKPNVHKKGFATGITHLELPIDERRLR